MAEKREPSRRRLVLGDVERFYQSDVVIRTFDEGFAGRWHTRIVPDAPGPKTSEEYVCSLLGVQPEHHVLDFGCGVGVVACSIAREIGCRVRGLNISSKQVELGRKLATELGLESQVQFDHYDGTRFPYETHEFDRVTFFESPCCVPDKYRLSIELYRVLKPDGACAGQDWVLTNGDISSEDYRDYILPIEASCEVSLLSLEELGELFREAGFSKVRVIDGCDIYEEINSSFTKPSEAPIRVDPLDSLAERLRKGNVALSNAFHKGLFTIGFVHAEKGRRQVANRNGAGGATTVGRAAGSTAPPPTSVSPEYRPDGCDAATGTIDIFSISKNLTCIECHKEMFDVQDSAPLDAFLRLVEGSKGCTAESSCKMESGRRRSARFNLFYHLDDKEGFYWSVRRFLDEVARSTKAPLNYDLLDEFLGREFCFERTRKVVTGVDLRADAAESRLKTWFMLARYPEKVERAIELHGDGSVVRRLWLHDEFLVGFDFRFDGRSTIKLYPDVRPEELHNPATREAIEGVLSKEAIEAMSCCRWTHVYIAEHNLDTVLQFHPTEPDDFVDRYLDHELAAPVHDFYKGSRLLDMVVSFREHALAPEVRPVRDFAVYYMPAREPGWVGEDS